MFYFHLELFFRFILFFICTHACYKYIAYRILYSFKSIDSQLLNQCYMVAKTANNKIVGYYKFYCKGNQITKYKHDIWYIFIEV